MSSICCLKRVPLHSSQTNSTSARNCISTVTGDANEHVERDLDINRLEIVLGRALNYESPLLHRPTLAGLLDLRVAAQVACGQRRLVFEQTFEVAFVDDATAEFSCCWSNI